ncbi:hypothetical protein [Paenibacillus marinisediminis]
MTPGDVTPARHFCIPEDIFVRIDLNLSAAALLIDALLIDDVDKGGKAVQYWKNVLYCRL